MRLPFIFGGSGLAAFTYWLGIAFDYVIAGGLIALGIYIALYWTNRFAVIVGMMLMGAGIGWGCFAYGKTIGGAHCYAEWKAANVKAEKDAKARDIAMAKLGRELAEKENAELAKQNFDLQEKIKAYEVATKDSAACRRATADDIKRLCELGSAAPGCKGAK